MPPEAVDARMRQRGFVRFLPAAIVVVALLLLLPRLVSFAQITSGFVAWPWQFDFTEGVNLSATMKLAQGHNIYAPNGTDSFTSAPYTPLFYLITAPLSLLAGPALWVGR